ncbi:MAG: HAD-IC family P-type ATPase, partial [Firmicutes bacterium]|nr:HAD-IC family P-type ATPase [Bacillota bacterium]
MDWYRYDIERIFNELGTSPQGLTQEEAHARLEKYGPNVLQEFGKRTLFQMFIAQFKDWMILILVGAALISGILGDLIDTIAIAVILLLNAVIGVIQEYRAQRAIEALKAMAAPSATVRRREGIRSIPAQFLVPGDVVILEAGNIVPADLRLLEAAWLKVEEAALTGESVPVEKDPAFVSEEVLSLGDRKNMVFKGTIVTQGRGVGVVVATGMRTEFGKIAAMLQGAQETMTPLQKRLAAFGRHLAAAVLVIVTVVLFLGLARGEELLHMILVAASLAVAAVPEALPAVATISLALGARRMVEHNALVRKLPAVESLGSVTYICTDKTGTLTENKMVVDQIWLPADNPESRELLFKALALSNDVMVNEDGTPIGDPTEVALYQAAKEQGMIKEHLEKTYPRVAEIPFDSVRKSMTTVHRLPEGGFISYTKGAPEVILERLATGQPLEGEGLGYLKGIHEEMTRNGLRVLAISFRIWGDFPQNLAAEAMEVELTFLGFVGLIDPPRPE